MCTACRGRGRTRGCLGVLLCQCISWHAACLEGISVRCCHKVVRGEGGSSEPRGWPTRRPAIAQLAERRTVVALAGILRSVVQIRLAGCSLLPTTWTTSTTSNERQISTTSAQYSSGSRAYHPCHSCHPCHPLPPPASPQRAQRQTSYGVGEREGREASCHCG